MVKTGDERSSYEASFFCKRWDGWFLILASASQGFPPIFWDLHLNSVITVKIKSGLLNTALFYNFYGIRDLLCELGGTNYQLFWHQLCSLCEPVFNWSGWFTNVDSQIIELRENWMMEKREEKKKRPNRESWWNTATPLDSLELKSRWVLYWKIKYSPSACLGQHI